MRAPLRLLLLGSFSLRDSAGNTIDISSRKNRALLAILVLSPGQAMTREKLVGLLWGDNAEEQARASLRQALAVLRKELGDLHENILQVRDDTVRFAAGTMTSDVIEFLDLAKTGQIGDLSVAATLYRGDFLADFSARDEALTDWLTAQRRNLADRFIAVLESLALTGPADTRIAYGKRVLSLDPLRESCHRALMQAYSDAGDRGQALKQFETCRIVLRQELDVEPSPQTAELRRRLAGNNDSYATAAAAGLAADSTPPEHPVVAVLPFALVGADADSRYLANAIAEDITTELSRHRGLTLIARTSTERFTDSPDIGFVGKSLGASHLVTGSLRIAGESWKIGVQVVAARTGLNIWSERFDMPRTSVLEMLDVVCAAIASVVEVRIAATGAEDTVRKPFANWTAYDHYLRGRDLSQRYRDEEAVPYLDRAVEADPELAPAFAWRAFAYVGSYFQNSDVGCLAIAETSAKRAIALDARDVRGHHALGLTRLWQRRHALAGQHYDMGLAINPGDVLLGYDKANWLTYIGRPEDALKMLAELRRRDPFHPAYVHELWGFALFQKAQYEDCIAEFDKLTTDHFWQHVWLAAAHAKLGRMSDARHEASIVLSMKPGFTLATAKAALGFETDALCAGVLEGLRRAGFSDPPSPSKVQSISYPTPDARTASRFSGRDRAVIAVLPFRTFSAEHANSGTWTHGLLQDIAYKLAKLRSIHVIAADSALAVNGMATPRAIGELLKVDYICRGRAVTDGGTFRVEAELVSCQDERIVWSEVFARTYQNVMQVVDLVGEQIIRALIVNIEREERNRAILKAPESLDAWDAYHRGLWHMLRFRTEDNESAAQFFALARDKDPTFSRSHAGLSFTHWLKAYVLHPSDRREEAKLALQTALEGLSADSDDPAVNCALGRSLWINGSTNEALDALGRSTDLSPSYAFAHYATGFIECQSGDPERALAALAQAEALSPLDPFRCAYLSSRGIALLRLGRFDEAGDWAWRGTLQPNAHVHIHGIAAMCLAAAGRVDDARGIAATVRKIHADYGSEEHLAGMQLSPEDKRMFRSFAKSAGFD